MKGQLVSKDRNPKPRVPKPEDFRPETSFLQDHQIWPGKARCQSWNPNTGQQCNKPAMVGKIRCRSHGGKTPSGPESPHFKTGAHSRYLPKGIRADYEAAMQNPAWLSLQHETAILDGRLAEVFRKIDQGESSKAWEGVKETQEALAQAVERYKTAAMQLRDAADQATRQLATGQMWSAIVAIEEASQKLDQLSRNGIEGASLWGEAYDIIEQRRKMVASQYKMNLELRQTITKERALILFGAMVEQFRQVIKNTCEPGLAREIMLETGQRVQRLISAPSDTEDDQ